MKPLRQRRTKNSKGKNMSQLQNQIGTAIVPAIIQALIVCVVRFFTIPWSIWKGAALRLAAMRQSSAEEKVVSSKSEFPVFDWFRAAWDGAIFLSWFIGILVSVIALIGGSMGYGGLMADRVLPCWCIFTLRLLACRC